jgi:hypothetical protein
VAPADPYELGGVVQSPSLVWSSSPMLLSVDGERDVSVDQVYLRGRWEAVGENSTEADVESVGDMEMSETSEEEPDNERGR